MTTSQEEHFGSGRDYAEPAPQPFLGSSELRRWSLYRAAIAEFVATLLFLYVTVATVVTQSSEVLVFSVALLICRCWLPCPSVSPCSWCTSPPSRSPARASTRRGASAPPSSTTSPTHGTISGSSG